jgi:hypothetical protein
LDGDREFVRIPGGESLNYWPLTVEAWVRPLYTGTLQSVVSKFCHNSGSLTDDAFFLGIEPNGTPRFQVSAGGTYQIVNGPTSLVNNGWHHLAGVYDGSRIRLYVDGTLRATTPLSGWIPFTSTPVYIGASREGTSLADADFFNGDIDDVRIWYSALSQTDILARMNSCWSDHPGGLLVRYIFEGEFQDRLVLDATGVTPGQPSGTAEQMSFLGRRGPNEWSCP